MTPPASPDSPRRKTGASAREAPKWPRRMGQVVWHGPPPSLREPTLIVAFEGWNDAGDAATIAARHLRKQWRCTSLAGIDPEMFFDFTSSRPSMKLKEQHFRAIDWPSNKVSVASLPDAQCDVAVLVGIEPQLRWRMFCDEMIGLADALGVGRVVTLGALLSDVPHSRPVQVYGTAEDSFTRAKFKLAPSTYEGPTGIVGVLSASFRQAGYATASLWSAVPAYMPAAPSPKAALALVQRAAALVGAPVDTRRLKSAAAEYEREVSQMVANDTDTQDYVARIEQAWDENNAAAADEPSSLSGDEPPLEEADPAALIADVERFLREAD